MGLNGIDISGYQKGINLGKLDGVDFVVIKATRAANGATLPCRAWTAAHPSPRS